MISEDVIEQEAERALLDDVHDLVASSHRDGFHSPPFATVKICPECPGGHLAEIADAKVYEPRMHVTGLSR